MVGNLSISYTVDFMNTPGNLNGSSRILIFTLSSVRASFDNNEVRNLNKIDKLIYYCNLPSIVLHKFNQVCHYCCKTVEPQNVLKINSFKLKCCYQLHMYVSQNQCSKSNISQTLPCYILCKQFYQCIIIILLRFKCFADMNRL